MRKLGILLALAAAPAFAQGNDSASTTAAASGGGQASGQVTVGAGAVSGAATIGASGPPAPSSGAQPPQPLAAGFEIRPRVDPFWGPARLLIVLDQPLRCSLIADANARRHCETRGGRTPGESRP